MFDDPEGPVEHYSFGRFVVAGEEHASSPDGGTIGCGSDIRIAGGVVSPWRERRGHLLEPGMLAGLDGPAPEALVIGLGAYGALQCPAGVVERARAMGISRVEAANTPEACRIYNSLCRGCVRAALQAHGPC
ncbi:MAG: Mth938-like domain-containing protein [Patescibacteria group bacterium]